MLEIVESYLDRGITVCFVKLRETCKTKFKHSGIYALLGPHMFFRKIQDAIDSLIQHGLLGAEFQEDCIHIEE